MPKIVTRDVLNGEQVFGHLKRRDFICNAFICFNEGNKRFSNYLSLYLIFFLSSFGLCL
jgi:hypothetical protein